MHWWTKLCKGTPSAVWTIFLSSWKNLFNASFILNCPFTCITGRTVKELGVDESIIASKFPYLSSGVGLLRIHHVSKEIDIVIDNKCGLFRSLTLWTFPVNWSRTFFFLFFIITTYESDAWMLDCWVRIFHTIYSCSFWRIFLSVLDNMLILKLSI